MSLSRSPTQNVPVLASPSKFILEEPVDIQLPAVSAGRVCETYFSSRLPGQNLFSFAVLLVRLEEVAAGEKGSRMPPGAEWRSLDLIRRGFWFHIERWV